MTDNAADMTGRENGLTVLLKKLDNGLFPTTCIYNSLSFVVVNAVKSLGKKSIHSNDTIKEITNDDELDPEDEDSNASFEQTELTDNNIEMFNVGDFVNSLASLFQLFL